jgi:hypothetical protein
MISKDSVIATLLLNDAMHLEVVGCVSTHFTGNGVYQALTGLLLNPGTDSCHGWTDSSFEPLQ